MDRATKQRLYLKIWDEQMAVIAAVKQPYLDALERGTAIAEAKWGKNWRNIYAARARVSWETRKGGVRERFFSTQRRIYKKVIPELFAQIAAGTYRDLGVPAPVRATLDKITIIDWWLTASGNWRRARSGSWPSHIDRIVIKLPTRTEGGELRVFGLGDIGDVSCTVNEEPVTLLQHHYPRGIGHGMAVDNVWLSRTFTGILDASRWETYSG